MRIIERNGKKEVYDPVRKKYVAFTPEEQVRQFVIEFLHQRCGIPLVYMLVETGIRVHGNFFRTDLQVRNKKNEPALLVECKRPEVALDNKVVEQAMRYRLSSLERFVAITNGMEFRCFERLPDATWRPLERYPDWNELNPDT